MNSFLDLEEKHNKKPNILTLSGTIFSFSFTVQKTGITFTRQLQQFYNIKKHDVENLISNSKTPSTFAIGQTFNH